MRILPVIDVMRGQVVRGMAGRRGGYRPVVSKLVQSCEPLPVAEAFRRQFHLSELYVADLDAIAGAPLSLSIIDELQRGGFRLWVDAGIRQLAAAKVLADAGVARIVVGLETVDGPKELGGIAAAFGGRITFSLDLRSGAPLGDKAAWQTSDPLEIAEMAVAIGIRRFIVLDLQQVGAGAGVGTDALCRRLIESHPEVEVFAGGGVRDGGDLRRLRDLGIHGVLVASALHDGRITRDDIAEL